MTIHDYVTLGGKNVIKEYLSSLPKDQCREGYRIRHEIIKYGYEVIQKLDTKPIRGKLREIRFSDNRVMYVLADEENIYFLHAFQKQKNKTEKSDIDIAIARAKEAELF